MKPFLTLFTALYMALSCTSLAAHDGYFYTGIGFGSNDNWFGCSDCWDDGGGVGSSLFAGYSLDFGNGIHGALEWRHYSQIDVGPPFNDDDESSLDTLHITFEKRW